ncbi:MAG: transcriptional regulator [Nocardioides sp.]|nr:transcriptional regulator [Nocardioides sp.]
MPSDLGAQLRAWRDRLAPSDVGVPEVGRRRAPGLRREEVAQRAGVSADYLVRLEQGRATHPSAQVVEALAGALVLGAEDRGRLYRLAGLAVPPPARMGREVTDSVRRLVQRLGDVPVSVVDASWQTLLQNRAADAVFGCLDGAVGRERNRAWRTFVPVSTGGPEGPGRLVEETQEAVERDSVGDLRAALLRLPDDPDLASLVADLRATSPRFAELWETVPARERGARRKTFDHPVVGRMTVDCDVMTVHGSDVQIVVFSAEPGTADAEALGKAVALGLQEQALRDD